VSIARNFSPRKIVGIDIDQKLVKMAWKNLHRYNIIISHFSSSDRGLLLNLCCTIPGIFSQP
jgi:tRNA G10  N-methylase Trm11